MAAALWEEEGGGADAVAGLLGDRASILGADDGGAGPGAYAYEAGALDPSARIVVAPRRAGGPSTVFPAVATAIALAGLALMAGWAGARRHGPVRSRYPAGIALLSVGCIVLEHVEARAQGSLPQALEEASPTRRQHVCWTPKRARDGHAQADAACGGGHGRAAAHVPGAGSLGKRGLAS